MTHSNKSFMFFKIPKLRVLEGADGKKFLGHLTALVKIYRNYFQRNILTSLKALLGKGFSRCSNFWKKPQHSTSKHNLRNRLRKMAHFSQKCAYFEK